MTEDSSRTRIVKSQIHAFHSRHKNEFSISIKVLTGLSIQYSLITRILTSELPAEVVFSPARTTYKYDQTYLVTHLSSYQYS
jgi:hypothetical protein